MTSFEFLKLSIHERLLLLQQEGEFVGTRIIPSYKISLYSIYGFYAEVSVILGLNQVHWIEVQNNKQILYEYTKDINLDDLLF